MNSPKATLNLSFHRKVEYRGILLCGNKFSVDIRVNDLPQPDDQDNNADSYKHQHNYRHSNTCHQDNVTRQLRVISLARFSGYSRASGYFRDGKHCRAGGYSRISGYFRAICTMVCIDRLLYTQFVSQTVWAAMISVTAAELPESTERTWVCWTHGCSTCVVKAIIAVNHLIVEFSLIPLPA